MTPATGESMQQKNERLIHALQQIDDSLKEIAIDLLLVVAYKPANYTGMKEYSLHQLWKVAGDYARTRHPDRRESDIILCAQKLEEIFKGCDIDLVSLDGIELPEEWGDKTPGDLYYHREIQMQNIILTVFLDQIESAMKGLTESKREREREVLKTWIAVLWNREPNDPRTIDIQIERFAHFYQKEFDRDMPVYIDAATITEMLTRARVAYPVDGMLCPMWYTGRNWLQAQMALIGE